MPEISVEICSNCHPFYTKVEKVLDSAGRVERFRARAAKTTKKPTKAKSKSAQGGSASGGK
jgi:large subunit ribosomal protein L31